MPYPPGGATDVIGRIIATRLGEALGQQVVVDNPGGAGGNIGAEAVAKAAPDGYTLLMGNTGSLTINPFLYAKVGCDTRRDFAPVGLVSSSPLVFVVHPSVPAQSLAELLALARQRPGELNFGTGGNGSISHLAAELLKQRSGVGMTHVPYKGGSPAIADLLAQQLQVVV